MGADETSIKSSIKAVVFDLGGVLIDWNPRYLYAKLFAGDEAAMEDFLTRVVTREWNERQDAGRPTAEGTAELAARHPEHSHLIEAFYGRWEEMLGGPLDDTVALLGALRRRAVPLYALTNWSAETYPIARERYDFLDWFEGIVVSGREGVAKPNPAIFHILIERYGLDARATLFIDDNRQNVEVATSLGFHTHHFKSPQGLSQAIAGHGLHSD